MRVGIPREIGLGERRVAATPETTKRLLKLGFEVVVERGAGELASFQDSDFEAAGATIAEDTRDVWACEIVLKVRPPEPLPLRDPVAEGAGAEPGESSRGGVREADVEHEADLLREGGVLVSFVWPSKNPELLARLATRKATVLAMDLIPRITRAQKMDALSSMANIAGYRAVIEAASFFGRFFTGQMTAAGKVPPAKVLVIGAGVAGLAAIGAARSLGAIVRAFDTRPGVKEQVESMGAEFLPLVYDEEGAGEGGYAKEMSPAFIAAEMALFAEQAREVDIIITTALIPGKAAPVLLSQELVASMKKGSVIVDLAADSGGNCALTEPGKVVEKRGVTIIGYVDLPSRLAPTASQLYGANLCHLLADMGGAKSWHVDLEDEVVRGALILEGGELRWPPPRKEPKKDDAPPAPKRTPSVRPAPHVAAAEHKKPAGHGAHGAPQGKEGVVGLLVLAAVLTAAGRFAPPGFLAHLTVFVLACFIGWRVVWNVSPALHTPLMSVTNAISGIILVGGMLTLGGPIDSPATILGALAIFFASINVAGGFLVTQRMLRMFRK